MRPRADRIADGQHDFPWGPEILETDMRAGGADMVRPGSGSDNEMILTDQGCLQYGRTTAEARADFVAPRLDPMTVLRTDGQRRRFCRNLAIAAGWRHGRLSHRELARIFNLPHSRIGEILKEMEALCSC